MANTAPKVAFYVHALYNGGIERVLVNLTQQLVQRGVHVDIVVDCLGYSPFANAFPPEVQVIDLKAQKILSRLPKLVQYLRQQQPAVLLSANHYPNEIAILAVRFARIWFKSVTTKIIVSEHTNLSLEANHVPPTSFRHWVAHTARWLYPLADQVIAVSQGVAEDLAHITRLPQQQIQTIYNPVITPHLFEQANASAPHPWFNTPDIPVILAIGRLEPQKSFATLITAFAQVRQTRSARLLILGEGSQRSQLTELVQALGLEQEVDMPGFVANPYACMAHAALVAVSSVWEGLCNVLIESLALGTPVVSTDCPSGPAEILAQGKYGELVPVGDSQALAEAMLKILACPKQPIASIASDWLNQFTVEQVVQRYLDVFEIV